MDKVVSVKPKRPAGDIPQPQHKRPRRTKARTACLAQRPGCGHSRPHCSINPKSLIPSTDSKTLTQCTKARTAWPVQHPGCGHSRPQTRNPSSVIPLTHKPYQNASQRCTPRTAQHLMSPEQDMLQDLGFYDLGCHTPLQPPTPNEDPNPKPSPGPKN